MAPVPLVSSRMRTLKLTRSMSREVGMDLHERVAQRSVERVHGAVALGGADVALAIDPDFYRRLGLHPAVGPLLDNRPPGFEAEQGLVLAGFPADQELERAIGGFEVITAVLEFLDPLDQLRRLVVAERDPASRPGIYSLDSKPYFRQEFGAVRSIKDMVVKATILQVSPRALLQRL